jgi:hypothetical protein
MDNPRECANTVFTSKTACGICARGQDLIDMPLI